MQQQGELVQDLLELLLLLQTLNPAQLRALCQFVQTENLRSSGESSPELWMPQLLHLFQSAKPEEINQLLNTILSQNEDEQDSRQNLEKLARDYSIPTRELENTTTLLLSLYQLQGLMQNLSILQLMKLFEVVPPAPHIQQLQLLRQIQQLFAQLQPETIQNLHQKMEEAQPGTEQQTLLQLLSLPNEYFQLYQPLRILLQLDLDELLKLREVLPALQPVQMLQLLQLLQLQPFDVLELRNLLNPTELSTTQDMDDSSLMMTEGFMTNDLTSSGGLTMNIVQGNHVMSPQQQQHHHHPGSDPSGQHNHEKKLTLQIVEQPPEKSVYKRNLKPNPTVMLVGDQRMNDGNLYVVASLVRCDSFTEEPKYLTGNRPVRVTSGRVVTFRKLKITTTSHQQQETLFCLKFDLRRYSGTSEDEYETLDTAHSNPICVLSHSTQMKPVPTVSPTITEVIPSSGPCSGGTRIAILGAHFADSPAARIRFDSTEVMPIFHGPGTLICHTPPHGPGPVPVRVANATKKWSDSSATFLYDESLPNIHDPLALMSRAHSHHHGSGIDGNNNGGNNNNTSGNSTGNSLVDTHSVHSSSGNLTSYAWQGSVEKVRHLLEHQHYDVNTVDSRSFSSLHYSCALGHTELTNYLLENTNVSVNTRDKYGATPLFWAAVEGHCEIAELLIAHGAHVNFPNFQGTSPLHAAISSEQREMVTLLLESGASVHQTTIRGETALHWAIAMGDISLMESIIRAGAFLYAVDEEGDSVLHWAVRTGDIPVVQFLLQQQQLLHQSSNEQIATTMMNSDEETPLALAFSLNDSRMVALLSSSSASVSSSSLSSNTLKLNSLNLNTSSSTSSSLLEGMNSQIKQFPSLELSNTHLPSSSSIASTF